VPFLKIVKQVWIHCWRHCTETASSVTDFSLFAFPDIFRVSFVQLLSKYF
jgi:hypothetical protein